ncbi:site-2 protease family protein [candidate division KSB1 bacterium]|nr:site-2 protease family protein [candidate division KSB1 bacterium]
MQQYELDKSQFNYQEYEKSRLGLTRKLKRRRLLIHIGLFILTIGTTWLAHGMWYATAIVSILLAHEMGHYLMCRRYKIPATLPYFLPFPFPALNPFGTMGAVIKMEGRIPNRKALFDVGAAGPISGLILTIPALIIGLKLSTIVEVQQNPEYTIYLGESLLFSQLSKLIIGNVQEGYDIMLHPVAFAGWAGLFVTALNLLPIGQLDGGHILYALFGRKSKNIYKLSLFGFIFICAIWYPGWLLLIILLIWFGFRHPPPLDDFTKLDTRRRVLGYIIFVIFLLSFTPVPFKLGP